MHWARNRSLGTRWAGLTAVAVAGSAFFGASLAHAWPNWEPWRGAVWLTLSAGTGWLLLVPTLIALTRSPLKAIDACLVTIAVGEAVLAVGAVANYALPPGLSVSLPLNASIVGASNVVMAWALGRRLRGTGLSAWSVLALWLLVLDGGGAVAFWIFYRLLFGGAA